MRWIPFNLAQATNALTFQVLFYYKIFLLLGQSCMKANFQAYPQIEKTVEANIVNIVINKNDSAIN